MNFESIKIIGKNYSVKEDPELLHDGKFGFSNSRTQSITYSPGQAHDQVRDTVIHEIIHAIDFGVHLELKEEQVHALAAGLYATLNDNPELTKWLFGKPEST